MPRLVLCRCCACGCVALAVCATCERRMLHDLLLRRDEVRADHPVADAWGALVASYYADGDEVDRETPRMEGLADYYRDGMSL